MSFRAKSLPLLLALSLLPGNYSASAAPQKDYAYYIPSFKEDFYGTIIKEK